ncbi:MAG: pyruvate kinase [Candidatus Cyclobacteriaceae bacterium M2_1C_046]
MKISYNKTKVIATVGPASNTKELLRELIIEGVDVFRLNFSHGTHEEHKQVITYVRELNEELNTNVCLLQDLQGPKIRVNNVEKNTLIEKGQKITITTEELMGNAQRISTSYKELPQDVSEGDLVLIDDGKIELRVLDKNATEVICEIKHGGELKSKKGINLPFTRVSAPSLTEKDKEDLAFGIENHVEWIALSFVRKAEDILDVKKIIEQSGKTIKVVAKIEKPDALKNIDEIIEATDAVMVARGDLGVEIVMEEVPMAQKRIVEKCNLAAKPVIIATQMMESMITAPRPTRAETNDIANAVMDGADALMLSAETAAGQFPIEVIRSMVRTISSVENQGQIYFKHYLPKDESPLFLHNTLTLAACRLAKASKAKAIVGMTQSGYTAFKISSHRPKAGIFIFSSNRVLLNTIGLIWGVRGIYYDSEVSTDQTFEDIEKTLLKEGYIKEGDIFITTAAMPLHKKGRTNALKINVAGS